MRKSRRLIPVILESSALMTLFLIATVSAAQARVVHPANVIEVRTLSSRADFVSGNDALIEIRVPTGTNAANIQMTLNGKVVTSTLRAVQNSGSFRVLLSGLVLGSNTLEVMTKSGGRQLLATLKMINHPITGPILSGPHMSPYECRTVESGLGAPLDANCSALRKVEYFYRTSANSFKPLTDPYGQRPADLVTTTTNDGKTVPYIVRVESGTINRSIFRIAILDEPAPAEGALEFSPSDGWNRKLVVSFGGGAGTQYNQGTNQATAALSHLYLSRGFAFMISTELVNQQHGNAVLQGEALMMLKEYFIERYGVPKWTMGSGGSGGAIQQMVITQIYPGLLDGLQPSASFPDSSLHTADCGLLQNFWRKADPATWTDAKRTAVEGYTKGTCAAWERSFVPVLTATNAKGCALNDLSKVYDPIKNPKGARCTMQEMRVNIYGKDPKTGFARKPQDNIGLQYGLAALNNGAISVDEFLELNQKIGGNDIDGNFIDQRSPGSIVAIRALYESGLMNSGGGGLANVPILLSRSYTDSIGDIHDRHRDLTIRARLRRANGSSDNQVIWIGPFRDRTETGSVDLASLSVETMNKWLDNLAADPAPPSTTKVARNKPIQAADSCWDKAGKKVVELATFDGQGICNTLYPIHSEPRLVAGAPLTNDVVKCALKPISYAEYKPAFNASQKAKMSTIFPTGVCDFSKPGIGQVPLKGSYRKY